jgi:hypothetical protein
MKQKSAKYLQINSTELVSTCDNIISQLGFNFERKITKRRGTKHTITYKLNTNLTIFGDVVKPTVMITNSYKGESPLVINFGYYRLVCENGLMMSDVDETNVIKIRHVRGPKSADQLKTLEYEIAASINRAVEYVAKLEQQLSKPMTVENREKLIESLPLPKKTKALVRERFNRPIRQEDNGNTLWHIWNVVNEANRETSRTENAAMTRDESLLSNIVRLAA